VALVSPWMRHGNLLNYVRCNEDASRSRLLRQVATGLLFLHSIGIIHGDLKCNNIMVSDEGNAQISDFGLGTVDFAGAQSASLSSVSEGNPRWSAPEIIVSKQSDGKIRRTCESDVYAFGMTALEVIQVDS
ncbi:kinase-like protein, partial [Schizopora paradoxa]